MDKKQAIIYSHGFGVRKDARGMFTDIAASIPNAEHVMFDYCEIDGKGFTIIRSLFEQAKRLKVTIHETGLKFPESNMNLICHSMGCAVAAVASPTAIDKTIFIAPGSNLNKVHSIEKFMSRPGATADTNGVITYPRADGSMSLIMPDYLDSLGDVDMTKLINELAKKSDLTIIKAGEDELIDGRFDGLGSQVNVIGIDGADHNFSGEYRQELINTVRKVLEL